MEYLHIENWEMIRSLLGVLICLVSVLYIKKQRKPDFKKAFNKEFTNKNYRRIKKQVERLKEENERTQQLLAKINNTSSLLNTDAKKEIYNDKHQPTEIRHRAKARKSEMEPGTPNNPYEQVRLFLASGMNREEIYDKLDLPTAEIDLMIKFNQLAQESLRRQQTDVAIRAYG